MAELFGHLTTMPAPQPATCEGDQPRVQPVSPVRVDGFTVYVANLRRYQKTAQIAANPKVELNYRIRPTQVRFMREWALEYFDLPIGQ